jgi:hypothetical protein
MRFARSFCELVGRSHSCRGRPALPVPGPGALHGGRRGLVFGREEWCEVVTDNLRAAETAKTDEAESALRTALAAARLRAVLPEHPDAVLNAAFSPNGAPRVQGAVATLPLYAPDGNAFAGVARSGISSVARR